MFSFKIADVATECHTSFKRVYIEC